MTRQQIFMKKESLKELNEQLLQYGHLNWKQYFNNANRIDRAYNSMMQTLRIRREIEFEQSLRFKQYGYHKG